MDGHLFIWKGLLNMFVLDYDKNEMHINYRFVEFAMGVIVNQLSSSFKNGWFTI